MPTTKTVTVADDTNPWLGYAKTAFQIVTELVPFIEYEVPGAAPAFAIAAKIIQGVIDAEPAALALYDQIKNGTVPTSAQLQQYALDAEDAYAKLRSDILAKLAALPT